MLVPYRAVYAIALQIGVINSQLKKSDMKIDQRLEELEEEEENKMQDPIGLVQEG